MNKEVSLAEAKATLSECIREVEKGKPVVIKRHGRSLESTGQLAHRQRIDPVLISKLN